jgi:hypothetical protein
MLRVTARIWKGAFLLRRFLISEPPCLPVAPITRIVDILINIEYAEIHSCGR